MNEENETNAEEVVTEDASETESLVTALAPIAMIVGVTAGVAYFIRKRFRRDDRKALEVTSEIIEATSTEV